MIGVSADRLSRAVLMFQDRRFFSLVAEVGSLGTVHQCREFSVSSFVTPGSDVVAGLPACQRATEARDWERAQMLVARERRRSRRRMVALSGPAAAIDSSDLSDDASGGGR
jgi:hypothetical protein